MASVTPRRNRDGSVSWRVQFRIDGRMCQETFLDSASAHQFGSLVDRVGGATARSVLERRRDSPADMPTLREFLTHYLDPDSGLLTGIEPGTREGYRRAAERSFLHVLGDYPVSAITKADVGRWLAWQEKQPAARKRAGKTQPVSAKTIKNYHAVLSQVLAASVTAKHRDDNPAYRTRLTKGRRDEPVFLTRDEFATLLHFTPPRQERFLLFLAGTGLRWSEATALTWGDINTHATPATVTVNKAWKKPAKGAPRLGPPKSERANRTISIPADVVDALGEPGEPGDLVFKGVQGGRVWYGRFRDSVWVPTVRKAQDKALCDAEGVQPLTKAPTPHDLRHSHVSWLIAAGVPLTHIQRRLGHEKITTTSDVYGHLQPDAHIAMADVIGAALEGVRPLRQQALTAP